MKSMNFTSKLTLALAAGSFLCPIAAYAGPTTGPTTGSTAAAVSIKFQDCKCGPTSGNFTINPGSSANGSGTGVQELSAAVATGETSAEANAGTKTGKSVELKKGEYGSNSGGTNASAKGWSQPVTFSYVSTSDVSSKKDTRDYSYSYKSQVNQEADSASSKKKSNSETYNATNSTNGTAANGTKGTGRSENETANSGSGIASNGSSESETSSKGKDSSSYSTSSNTSGGTKKSTEDSSSQSSNSASSNSQNGNSTSTVDNTTKVLNTDKTKTRYDYTGSAAGLYYIPVTK
jgi:hypothetical protein